MKYVVPLSRVELTDAGRVGRKAAVLGELLAAGFPVPDGFAVGTEALDATLKDASVDRDDRTAVAGALRSVPLPEDLSDELRAALAGLRAGPVAVRSSGAAEDLADRSYAGQYESVLGVDGFDALVAALRECWASAFSERIATYDRGGPADTRIGVLVQRMVPAEVAGVAFSANPVTGDPTETVLSAVTGLGDRLMAGAVSADEWVVRAGTASQTSGTAGVLDAGQVGQVAELTARVAAHFGSPQDVEWAVASGTVQLLQARPITVIPAAVAQVPVEDEVPPGFWVRDRTSDAPWVPLKTSVFLPVYQTSAGHVFAFTSGAAPHVASIGGWVYLSPPPDTMRERAERMERIAARVAAGQPRALVDRWSAEWKPAFAVRIARLRAVPRAELADDALVAHLREIVALFAELHDVYFTLAGAAIQIISDLGAACEDLMGWSAVQTLRLRGGLTGDHMGAAIRLGELAALAAGRPALRAYLDRDELDPARLGEVDAGFAAGFADYVSEYAHRTVGFDLTEPTLAERPGTLLQLVRTQIDQRYDFAAERAALAERQAAALAEARQAVAGHPVEYQQYFEKAFENSEAASPVRDEKVFYAVSVWALLRYAALELGTRLVRARTLDEPGDVLFLELDEAVAALEPGAADPRPAIAHRRGQYAWAATHAGPPVRGTPPAEPAPDPTVAYSPGAERAHRVGQWSMALAGGGPRQQSTDGSLRGLAASPGRYTGPVRVVTSVSEFDRLRRGDVLVCPVTTAQWAVLFPSVGALVTDHGSLLSHPAIVAREYGVPAVLATGTATSTLRDGQLVTVDGSAGVVRTAG